MNEPSKTPRTNAVCTTPIMGEECTPHKWEQLQTLARDLERELSISEGSSKWVPVTERLPDDWKLVQVWLPRPKGPTEWNQVGQGYRYGESEYSPAGWTCGGIWVADGPPEPTHWMPLPEAPK